MLLCVLLAACGDSEGDATSDNVASTASSSSGTTDEGSTDAQTSEGEPELGVAALFDPPGGWLASPWPTDHHRGSDGSIDLSRFPLPEGSIFQTHIDYGEQTLRGFALNGAVYFPFAGPLDPASLSTLDEPDASVQLVNVTPGSPAYGLRLPLTTRLYTAGADPYVPHDTLALRTLPGLALREGEVYCAWVNDALSDIDGLPVSRVPAFTTAIESDEALAPLRAYLDALDPSALDHVVSATCFTTDTATRELVEIQQFLLEDPEAPAPAVIDSVSYVSTALLAPGVAAHHLRGTYLAPKFLSGQQPHCLPEDGGGFEFDDQGRPIVQGSEMMRFSLLVPDAPAPAGGWPLVICAHGSGGDYETCTVGGAPPIEELAGGLAVIGIDQPLHGARGPGINPWSCVLNPATMTTALRHAAIDVLTLARAVQAGGFSITLDGPAIAVEFDSERLYFFGHSLGGLSGAITLGTVPQLRGGLLSAAGGLTIYSALYRQDWLLFLPAFADYLGVSTDVLSEYHPALTLVQLLNETADPINYARLWFAPQLGGPKKHVLMSSGDVDIQTPPITTLILAAAAGVPVVAPPLLEGATHEHLGLDPVTMPVSANIDDQATAAVLQVSGDHFVAYTDPEVRAARSRFFTSLVTDGAPMIDTTP